MSGTLPRALAREIIAALSVSSASDQAEASGAGGSRIHSSAAKSVRHATYADYSRWAAFGQRDWLRALDWLDQSGLALLFWDRLTGLGAEDSVPREIGQKLARNLAGHRLRIAAMAAEFDSINRRLESAGIEYAVLKGFALVPDYCPDAALRPTYDYDYLVRPAAVDRARQAFDAAGFVHRQGREKHPLVFIRPDRPPHQALCRDELYDASFPRIIELHHSLWEAEPLGIPVRLEDGVLDSVQSREWQGLRFGALSDEDALVFQVLHAFRHMLRNWCRLGLLRDMAYFLERRAADREFWERFAARINDRPPLPEMAGVVFSLSANLFGARVPEAIRAQTVDKLPGPLALWVERYGPDSALDNFLTNKFSLFLHREFVPDPSVWRAVRLRLLFPVQRPNKAVEARSPRLSSRLAAAAKQTLYGGRRVVHHLTAALRYGWESYRWQRLRTGGR